MAGLNSFLSDTAKTTETMPAWFNTAQENLVKGAAAVQQPAIGETAAQYATTAFGPGSTFQKGADVLSAIGSGAANPWMVTTGAGGEQTVAPNVATPMGGLFKAQTDYLNQIMPDIAAKQNAQAIAGGGFGSRMNLSGVQRAQQEAATDLFQKQMQAALQSQQTGAQAAAGLGNIGGQEVKSALDTATLQQGYPYAGYVNLANIIGKVSPEKIKEQQVQLGLANQLGALGQFLSGAPAGLKGAQGGLENLMKGVTDIGNWLGGKLSNVNQYDVGYDDGASYDDEYWGYDTGGNP
jgi:hypothetical protein